MIFFGVVGEEVEAVSDWVFGNTEVFQVDGNNPTLHSQLPRKVPTGFFPSWGLEIDSQLC